MSHGGVPVGPAGHGVVESGSSATAGECVVERATTADLAVLVGFESALFADDAVANDVNVDPTWPRESAHDDFVRMIDADDCLVLVARRPSGRPAGHLVGYVARAAPTRRPVSFAVLRSLYVATSDRRRGVAGELTRAFVAWGRSVGCVQAHVDHYVANETAAAFYERHGFAAVSTSRSLTL